MQAYADAEFRKDRDTMAQIRAAAQGGMIDMNGIFRDMTCGGHPAPAELQKNAFISWLRPGSSDGYSGLAAQMNRKCPLPDSTPYPYSRAADRLVQNLRKAGMIEKDGRKWRLTDNGAVLREQILEQLA